MYQDVQHQMHMPGSDWPPLIKGMQILIEFPSQGKLRSRRVVSRSNARATGKYPGFKTGRMLQYESQHELHAMQLLDACPHVIGFREQPCVIRYGQSGRMRLHYPDLMVVTADRSREFWEIKTAHDAMRPEVKERTNLLSSLLPSRGFGYRLMRAEDLGLASRLANARLLVKLGRKMVTPLQRERIRRLFRGFTLPWAALVLDENGRDMRPQICRLILEGVLAFDITYPLTDATPIRWVFDKRMEGGQSWDSLVSFKAH